MSLMLQRGAFKLICGSALTILLSSCSGTQPISNPGFVPSSINLPVIYITTAGSAPVVSETDYLSGSFGITPVPGSSDVAYSGTMQIKGHGNSTWLLPKKPWSTAKMPEKKRDAMLRAIVAIEVAVDTIEASWKLGQHKTTADQYEIARMLEWRGDWNGQALSEVMKQRFAALANVPSTETKAA